MTSNTTQASVVPPTNHDLFLCVTGIILNQLFDEFPMSYKLDRLTLLEEVVDLLEWNKHMARLHVMDAAKVENQNETEAEPSESIQLMERICPIYDKTCEFLKSEGYIVEDELGLSLNAKTLVALGYVANNPTQSKLDSSPIDLIKDALYTDDSSLIIQGVMVFFFQSASVLNHSKPI